MTTSLSLFDPYSVDDQAIFLASHLPEGRVWEKAFKPDSNIGKLVRALGVEFYRFEVLLGEAVREMDLTQADQMLVEWEQSVGIPDSCFSNNAPIATRRLQVSQKFGKFGGVQTNEDFVRVAGIFGFNVKVSPGSAVGCFPLQFPIVFFDETRSATHTIIVEILGEITGDEFFPLVFPIPFSVGGKSFLECIFNKLAPANVKVIVVSEGSI